MLKKEKVNNYSQCKEILILVSSCLFLELKLLCLISVYHVPLITQENFLIWNTKTLHAPYIKEKV